MSSDRIEIVKELRALEKFCAFPSGMTGEDRERYLKDYLSDIQEFPLDAIRSACAEWRKSGSVKFPTSGMLIPIIKRFIGAPKDERLEPWRALTDDEYRALGLPEKIRHHQILANQARRKAGPMWKNGRPAAPDELPDIWHSWTRQAENHEAEASRLRKHLRPSSMGLAAE